MGDVVDEARAAEAASARRLQEYAERPATMSIGMIDAVTIPQGDLRVVLAALASRDEELVRVRGELERWKGGDLLHNEDLKMQLVFMRQRAEAAEAKTCTAESQLADARRGMREEAAKLRAAVEPLIRAAEGLSFGTDWNGGTAAKSHGYRQKLMDALPAALAALSSLPVEAGTTDERTKALEELALMDADEIMALPDAPPATGDVTRNPTDNKEIGS